jgi:hypothetical protein
MRALDLCTSRPRWFPADHDAPTQALEAWSTELKQWKLDAPSTGDADPLPDRARPRDAARDRGGAETQWAREAEEREAAFQARVAQAKAAGKLRELGRHKVVELIREAGHEAETYGSQATPNGQAVSLGVISNVSTLGGSCASMRSSRISDLRTIFADNLVPHVLRVDGVLTRRAPGRANRQRAAARARARERRDPRRAVHSCELVAASLRVPPRVVDVWLWNRGRELATSCARATAPAASITKG